MDDLFLGENFTELGADLSAATVIGEYACAYCRDMKTVVLNDVITELKPYTFAGCSGLTEINLDKITTVGEYAFTECESLKKADLSSATYIDKYAFVYNKSLTTVILNADPLKQAADETPAEVARVLAAYRTGGKAGGDITRGLYRRGVE